MISRLDHRLRYDSLEPLVRQAQLFQSSSLSLPTSEERIDNKRCSISPNSSMNSIENFFLRFTNLLKSLSQATRELFTPIILLFSHRAFNEALNKLDLPDN